MRSDKRREFEALLPATFSTVRRYESEYDRAVKLRDGAKRDLAALEQEVESAKQVWDAAKAVADAAVRDRTVDVDPGALPRPQVAWLHIIANEPVANMVFLERAAARAGWEVKPATMRQRLVRLVQDDILERVGRGDYRVTSIARIRLAYDAELTATLEADAAQAKADAAAGDDLLGNPFGSGTGEKQADETEHRDEEGIGSPVQETDTGQDDPEDYPPWLDPDPPF